MPALRLLSLVLVSLALVPSPPASAQVIVDGQGGSGFWPDAESVSGRPAIAYGSQANSETTLQFVRADNVQGTAWGTPVTVTDVGSGFSHIQMKVVDGRPMIVYQVQDPTNGLSLACAHAQDASGTAWDAPILIDGVDAIDISMAMVNGQPAIVYSDARTQILYRRATASACASWSAAVAVTSIGTEIRDPSLAVVQGRPAVSFGVPGPGVRYVRASNVNGTVWPAPTVITDAVTSNRPGTSLVVTDGIPAIVYSGGETQAGAGALRISRADNGIGSTWSTDVVIASDLGGPNRWTFSTYVGPDGLLSVAFGRDNGTYVTTSTNAAATGWDASREVVRIGARPERPSLVGLPGGRAGVASRVAVAGTGSTLQFDSGALPVDDTSRPSSGDISVRMAPQPLGTHGRLLLDRVPTGPLRVTLLDARGRVVATVFDGVSTDRQLGLAVDARDLAAGVYLARVAHARGVDTLVITVAR